MMKIIFLPTLRSAVLNSHIRATAVISFMLTNAIMKTVAGSTSSGLCSEHQLPNSSSDFMNHVYLRCRSVREGGPCASGPGRHPGPRDALSLLREKRQEGRDHP